METTLVSFIDMLRSHDVRVSPAETLDAMAVTSLLGYTDRDQLRLGLGQTLAKSAIEKQRFERCFDQFFNHSSAPAAQNDDPAQSIEPNPASGAQAREALEQALQENPALGDLADSELWQALNDNPAALDIAIAQAGDANSLSDMRLFTQKGQYIRRMLDTLGEQTLRDAIITLEAENDPVANTLQGYREWLRDRVKAQVERAYLLQAEGRNQQFLDDRIASARLNTLELHHKQRVNDLVRKMARKLAARYARKRKVFNRGQLDMNKTLRRGIPNDGLMFDTHWRKVKKNQPQILALCDVSGSVAAYARFLLMFLYSLQDVLPKVRSFAFSSHLGEVGDFFKRYPLEEAIEAVNRQYGGATDYGRSLEDFADLAMDDVNHYSTVIILGDARNNHNDPRLDIVQQLYQRARQVIWLNPETRTVWGSGDSDMLRYQSACHFAAQCGTLNQLERIVDQLLRSTR